MPTNRRDFLKVATAAAFTCAASPAFAQNIPTGERINMAVIGTGSRGMQHGVGFAALPGVFVKYVCDVDDSHSAAALKSVEPKAAANDNTPAPKAIRDLHEALADKEIHAVSIATPDH